MGRPIHKLTKPILSNSWEKGEYSVLWKHKGGHRNPTLRIGKLVRGVGGGCVCIGEGVVDSGGEWEK